MDIDSSYRFKLVDPGIFINQLIRPLLEGSRTLLGPNVSSKSTRPLQSLLSMALQVLALAAFEGFLGTSRDGGNSTYLCGVLVLFFPQIAGSCRASKFRSFSFFRPDSWDFIGLLTSKEGNVVGHAGDATAGCCLGGALRGCCWRCWCTNVSICFDIWGLCWLKRKQQNTMYLLRLGWFQGKPTGKDSTIWKISPFVQLLTH